MADPLSGLKKSAQDFSQKMNAVGHRAFSEHVSEHQPTNKPLPNGLLKPKPGLDKEDLRNLTKPLGSMKKGGKVPKTGMYQLHAGEKVVPARAASALGGNKPPKKKGSGKKPHKMVIEHMDDNTFGIEHLHKPSDTGHTQPPEKFTAANPKHLTRHVRNTYGGGQQDDDPDMGGV
jgi:hypothetical protein